MTGKLHIGAHMAEIWKPIPRFPKYEASTLGNIRRIGKTKPLSKVKDADGYIVHCFLIEKKRFNVFAHKMVAETFIGPCPAGQLVRHRDGTRDNNIPSNLLYGTPKQNSEDMVQMGTQNKGEDMHTAKLKPEDVLLIRSSNKTLTELAKEFGVTTGNIWHIRKNITWKHI